MMSKVVMPKHSWAFAARFRAGAFGWRSEPAITRIKEAVSEIKATSKKDPILGAEGAILFLQKLSPALQNIDGSSGAIGTAVNRAIDTLVPVIAKAPVDHDLRHTRTTRSPTLRRWAITGANFALPQKLPVNGQID